MKPLFLAACAIMASCTENKSPSDMDSPADRPPEGELWMNRSLGLESYKISSASWNHYKDPESGMLVVSLYVGCDKPIQQFEDTDFLGGMPSWELNIVNVKVPEGDLAKGCSFDLPDYDESQGGWLTNFYFTHHQGSADNTIEILDREGTRLLIRIHGTIEDVNDASRPKSKVTVENWFDHDPEQRRSVS